MFPNFFSILAAVVVMSMSSATKASSQEDNGQSQRQISCWLTMTLSPCKDPGTGITLLAPKLTKVQSIEDPHDHSWGGEGPASWHLSFNNTYLNQEFSFEVFGLVTGAYPYLTPVGENPPVLATQSFGATVCRILCMT